MRIVAVLARHMARHWIDNVLGWTVRIAVLRDRVDADFLKIGGHVLDSHCAAVMARKAVLFRRRKFHQAFPGAGKMRGVTILTSHGGNSGRSRFGRLAES